ncbi:dynein intermediate chain 2, ciliary-like [Penaeus japonicus]|uniref:dynein intermediate chain 2, ciliary-like n=1 Tax=Penaeus japonicus TaxID=27405 RepID=UPI001C70B1F8|nr:dynein intermediate chain 2, ciliary-like [Penaeus japonicus]
MLSRLTQIVGVPEGEPLPKPVRSLPTPALKRQPSKTSNSIWPTANSNKMKRLKLLCKMNAVLGQGSGPTSKKKAKPEKKKVHWRKYGKKEPAQAKNAKPMFEIKVRSGQKRPIRDRIVEIRLTANSELRKNAVRFDVTKQAYLPEEQDLTMDLLTLDPRDLYRNEPPEQEEPEEELDPYTKAALLAMAAEKQAEEEEDPYCGVISKEELARIDAQANPFNFSERVSQTAHFALKTEPANTRIFSDNVGFSVIYDAYNIDFEMKAQKLKEEEMEKERDDKKDKSFTPEKMQCHSNSPPPAETPRNPRDVPQIRDVPGLPKSSRIVERMITQNLYDDITQDFKYWEDGGDEYHPMEGSLLPLWKFSHDNSRTLVVSDITWSPVYPDLFAAAYTAGDICGTEGAGMLCLFTLKNPACPERTLHSPCSVMCVGFHPTRGSMLAAGWSDGTVVVYNVEYSDEVRAVASTAMNGKHILPVCKVKWVHTDPGEDLRLFSVAKDGRLTQWYFGDSRLKSKDIFSFTQDSKSDKNSLEGGKVFTFLHHFIFYVSIFIFLSVSKPKYYMIMFSVSHTECTGTCIDFRPDNESELLIGIDTGCVIQCSVSCSSHTFIRYPAHSAPVRDVGWNKFYYKVFLSCSVDWSVKVWLQETTTPLITLDMGGSVAATSWSAFSSSVFVAVTDEGRIYVYDLHVRQSRPLCVQSVMQKRRVVMTSLSFNTFHPIILIGGERGHLISLKLSPNLRQVNKDPRDLEEMTHSQVEMCKMERLIAVNKG